MKEADVGHLPAEETSRHDVRVGWSTDSTSIQLGKTYYMDAMGLISRSKMLIFTMMLFCTYDASFLSIPHFFFCQFWPHFLRVCLYFEVNDFLLTVFILFYIGVLRIVLSELSNNFMFNVPF